MRELWQPGIGYRSWSIIVFVVSCSCRLMGRGVSVIAPWEMGTRMVGIVACGVVLPGKLLMSLLIGAVLIKFEINKFHRNTFLMS